MIEVIAAASLGAAVAGGGLLLLPSVGLTRVGLSFPPDLTAEQVQSLLTLIAGLPAHSRVVSTVEGAAGRLSFGLEARDTDVRALKAGLQGAAPGIRFSDAEDPAPAPATLRARMGWRGSHVLLRTDQVELASASLLGVLRQAGRRERMQLRVRLRPVVRPRAPQRERDRGLVDRLLSPSRHCRVIICDRFAISTAGRS